MQYIYAFLDWLMSQCYGFSGNYGWAIVLFTFATKILLLPLTLWTYFNSITMVKIQPDINYIKVRYYGQPDEIAEEQAKLFKEKGYHPLLSTIPTFVQLFLLIGVVEVIKRGAQDPSINISFGSVNLGLVPSQMGDLSLIWSPIMAGLAALILCIAQNHSNILQSEQSKWNKLGVSAFSVGMSLYLGWFVSIGTAFYWICSNLFAVLQLYICNWIIRPRRYVDYERLEDSRRQLAELQQIGGSGRKRESFFSENRKRERADYKRFFSVANKHLVFYSESSGFYKYFKGYIEYLLENTNITIHYITSDPGDQIFKLADACGGRIRAYYIGENRLITLMMKMDTDVMVMTMPDLDNYHIKRSYVRKDIEYIFVQHDMNSHSMLMRKGCVDHFDTIFCTGVHQKVEIEQAEEIYGLPKKSLIEVGYPLIDDMRAAYRRGTHKRGGKKKILIAPSWQKDNIIDSCLEKILDALKDFDADIIVRPHPQEVRLKQQYMNFLEEKYSGYDNIEIQTDFSSDTPVMEADLLITDWSGICWEYAFVTYRPVLFINTPMKVMNPEWERIPQVPINIAMREQIGKSLNVEQLGKLADVIEDLLAESDSYAEGNRKLAQKYIYNLDHSAEVGGKYIISAVQEKISRKARKGQ